MNVQLAISKARFVAVSATIPNVTDIATWLNVPPAGLQLFGEDHRPCRLKTFVRGYNMPKVYHGFRRHAVGQRDCTHTEAMSITANCSFCDAD